MAMPSFFGDCDSIMLGYSASMLGQDAGRKTWRAPDKAFNAGANQDSFFFPGSSILSYYRVRGSTSSVQYHQKPFSVRNVTQEQVGNKGVVALRDWSIHPAMGAKGVVVKGYRNEDGKQKSSCPIDMRVNSRMLISSSGVTYKLVGPMCTNQASECNKAFKYFSDGFPDNWRILEKSYLQWIRQEAINCEVQESPCIPKRRRLSSNYQTGNTEVDKMENIILESRTEDDKFSKLKPPEDLKSLGESKANSAKKMSANKAHTAKTSKATQRKKDHFDRTRRSRSEKTKKDASTQKAKENINEKSTLILKNESFHPAPQSGPEGSNKISTNLKLHPTADGAVHGDKKGISRRSSARKQSSKTISTECERLWKAVKKPPGGLKHDPVENITVSKEIAAVVGDFHPNSFSPKSGKKIADTGVIQDMSSHKFKYSTAPPDDVMDFLVSDTWNNPAVEKNPVAVVKEKGNNFKTPVCDKSSTIENLHEWAIIIQSGAVSVEGIIRKCCGKESLLRTSAVCDVGNRGRTISTLNGSKYNLVGRMQLEASMDAGLPTNIARKFQNGFFPAWRKSCASVNLARSDSGSYQGNVKYDAECSMKNQTFEYRRGQKLSEVNRRLDLSVNEVPGDGDNIDDIFSSSMAVSVPNTLKKPSSAKSRIEDLSDDRNFPSSDSKKVKYASAMSSIPENTLNIEHSINTSTGSVVSSAARSKSSTAKSNLSARGPKRFKIKSIVGYPSASKENATNTSTDSVVSSGKAKSGTPQSHLTTHTPKSFAGSLSASKEHSGSVASAARQPHSATPKSDLSTHKPKPSKRKSSVGHSSPSQDPASVVKVISLEDSCQRTRSGRCVRPTFINLGGGDDLDGRLIVMSNDPLRDYRELLTSDTHYQRLLEKSSAMTPKCLNAALPPRMSKEGRKPVVKKKERRQSDVVKNLYVEEEDLIKRTCIDHGSVDTTHIRTRAYAVRLSMIGVHAVEGETEKQQENQRVEKRTSRRKTKNRSKRVAKKARKEANTGVGDNAKKKESEQEPMQITKMRSKRRKRSSEEEDDEQPKKRRRHAAAAKKQEPVLDEDSVSRKRDAAAKKSRRGTNTRRKDFALENEDVEECNTKAKRRKMKTKRKDVDSENAIIQEGMKKTLDLMPEKEGTNKEGSIPNRAAKQIDTPLWTGDTSKWTRYRKTKLNKLVQKKLSWEEIAIEMKMKVADCEAAYRDLFKQRKRKRRDKKEAKIPKDSDELARRGTLKHRRQVRKKLEILNNPKPQFQDAFSSGNPFSEGNAFSADLFALQEHSDDVFPMTPNTKPPVSMNDMVATPAWFKTPVSTNNPTCTTGWTPFLDANTPASMKQVSSPEMEEIDKQEKRREADRVIVQMQKKMMKGTLREFTAKEEAVKKNRQNSHSKRKKEDDIDYDIFRLEEKAASDVDSEEEVDEYFDVES